MPLNSWILIWIVPSFFLNYRPWKMFIHSWKLVAILAKILREPLNFSPVISGTVYIFCEQTFWKRLPNVALPFPPVEARQSRGKYNRSLNKFSLFSQLKHIEFLLRLMVIMLYRLRHAETDFDASKIMISNLRIKNVLEHRKYYFRSVETSLCMS